MKEFFFTKKEVDVTKITSDRIEKGVFLNYLDQTKPEATLIFYKYKKGDNAICPHCDSLWFTSFAPKDSIESLHSCACCLNGFAPDKDRQELPLTTIDHLQGFYDLTDEQTYDFFARATQTVIKSHPDLYDAMKHCNEPESRPHAQSPNPIVDAVGYGSTKGFNL